MTQETTPHTPPPRVVMWRPFADSEPMQSFPGGYRESAQRCREQAARLLSEAFELEAMAAEAELTRE